MPHTLAIWFLPCRFFRRAARRRGSAFVLASAYPPHHCPDHPRRKMGDAQTFYACRSSQILPSRQIQAAGFYHSREIMPMPNSTPSHIRMSGRGQSKKSKATARRFGSLCLPSRRPAKVKSEGNLPSSSEEGSNAKSKAAALRPRVKSARSLRTCSPSPNPTPHAPKGCTACLANPYQHWL